MPKSSGNMKKYVGFITKYGLLILVWHEFWYDFLQKSPQIHLLASKDEQFQ